MKTKEFIGREMNLLIIALAEFSKSPSKEGARICRDLLTELKDTVGLQHEDKQFIEQAAVTVARPYQSAQSELQKLIEEYRLKQLRKNTKVIVDFRRIRRAKALITAVDYESEVYLPAGDVMELVFLGKVYREIIDELLKGEASEDCKTRAMYLIEQDKIKPTVDDL